MYLGCALIRIVKHTLSLCASDISIREELETLWQASASDAPGRRRLSPASLRQKDEGGMEALRGGSPKMLEERDLWMDLAVQGSSRKAAGQTVGGRPSHGVCRAMA